MAIADQIEGVESGGNPTAANPNSSAAGPGQFIDSTWLATVKQHAPDIAGGKSDAEILALKNDPQLAARPENVALAQAMTDAYASDNQAYLAKNGLPVTPGNTYLAHFAGPQGAAKILQADPNAPVADILGPAVMKANPFLRGMTAQGLQAWAATKMGGHAAPPAPTATAPTQSQPAAPPQPQQPQAPSPAAPVMPSFAAAPTFLPPPEQPEAPPPLILPPRKQIDLSGLKAALAAYRAPIFASSRG